MCKTIFRCCLAILLVRAEATAQPCKPAAIQQQLAAFYDHFKQLDTLPAWDFNRCNQLYRSKEKQLYFMGSRHMNDTAYPLFRKIDSVIKAFKPGIIMIENYLRLSDFADIREATAGGADAGFVGYLGKQQKIRIKSWDHVPEAYNRLIGLYGYDSALVVLLNSIGDDGWRAQCSEERYAQFKMGFQLQGGVMTPAQQSYEYYKQLFLQFFQRPLLLPQDTAYSDLQTAVFRNKARQRMDSRLSQFRDERLLRVMQAAMATYNKVYLQAGAAHYESLKAIAPCFLTPPKESPRQLTMRPSADGQQYVVTVRSGQQNQEILITFTDGQDSSALQRTRIEKQLTQFAPGIVATYGPAELYAAAAETFSRAGINGFTRHLAIGQQIPLTHWSPEWGDVYYEFAGKYSQEDLYLTCMAMHIFKDGPVQAIDEFRDRFFAAGNVMEYSGYPFQRREFDFDTLIGRIIKDAPGQHARTMEEMLSLFNAKRNKQLEADIRRYQVEQFFIMPLQGLQNLPQKRIFLQMDEAYRPLVQQLLARSK